MLLWLRARSHWNEVTVGFSRASRCTIDSACSEEARAWERGVDDLAQQDSDVAEYVRTLEEAKDATDLPEASGDAIAREFERYLRRRGDTGDSDEF